MSGVFGKRKWSRSQQGTSRYGVPRVSSGVAAVWYSRSSLRLEWVRAVESNLVSESVRTAATSSGWLVVVWQ